MTSYCRQQHSTLLVTWWLVFSLSVAAAFLTRVSSTTTTTGIQQPLSWQTSRILPPTTVPQRNINYNKKNLLVLLAKKKKKKSSGSNIISVNRIAYRNYEILDTLEAGISLKGTEVKAIRNGKLNLRDGFVRTSKNGRSAILYNVHIGKYDTAGIYFQHEEKRPRPLLVHKEQARKWKAQTEQAGMTIVPLKAYFSQPGNLVKLEIALCRGKNVRDKRADIKERDAKREAGRIMKSFRL
jgi:SsrA-binding protein